MKTTPKLKTAGKREDVMKKFIFVLLVVFAAMPVFAVQYEAPMLNMTVPTGLEQGQMYFKFDARFAQDLRTYPSDDLFALLDNSADINIELRYLAAAGLEINAGYTTVNREQTAGLSYVLKFPDLFFNVQAGIQYFTFKGPAPDKYEQNLFYSLSIQSVPLLDEKLFISVDAAFDGYAANPGLAIGVSYEVLMDISIIAEYYPVIKIDAANGFVGATGVYSFGFKIETSGHQFIFKCGNSTDIGMRRMMLGTNTLDMYAGFSIMRLIRF
jgi:hypothetical protein